jgi:hypothetical protein
VSTTYILIVAPETHAPEEGLMFLESPTFSRRADQYLGEAGRDILINTLLEDPESGKVIEDTDGARKIRVAMPGRGKSGGARVIYYYRHIQGAVFFLHIFPKNEKENLSADNKKDIRRQIQRIKAEAYP